MDNENEKFNVVQFFSDLSNEEFKGLSAKEATAKAIALATSVGAKIGTTIAVAIVDSGDCTNWHWEHGVGLIFPLHCSNKECKAKDVVAGMSCHACGSTTGPLDLNKVEIKHVGASDIEEV